MLSWSGTEQGIEIDLANVQTATGGVAVSFAQQLVDFATAATEFDLTALAKSRDQLISVAGVAITTGARRQTEVVADRLVIAQAMGVDKVVSRR